MASANKLKNLVIERDGKICNSCGLVEWLGNEIPLETHHTKNKSHQNYRNVEEELDDVVLLCPNCHYFTNNYRGRGKPKPTITDEMLVTCVPECTSITDLLRMLGLNISTNNHASINKRLSSLGLSDKFSRKTKVTRYSSKKCKFCTKEYKSANLLYCSRECAIQDRPSKSRKPSKEDFYKLRQLYTNVHIANMYGITESAVRKWIKSYRNEI